MSDDSDTCTCPEPDLCDRVGVHLTGRLHWLYHHDRDQHNYYETKAREKAAAEGIEFLPAAFKGKTTATLAWRYPLIKANREKACIHLGEPTGEVQRCKTCKGNVEIKLRACEVHKTCTTHKKLPQLACCASCPDYLPEGDGFFPKPNDPHAGIVVGVYKWPKLAELQIRTIRHFAGPVPILLSDDCSPDGRHEQLIKIAQDYEDVTVVGSDELWRAQGHVPSQRLGHTGGDVAAIYNGIVWASSRGLSCVAKLSQRCLVTKRRWLQDAAWELFKSGQATGARRCRGRHNFDLRTELLLFQPGVWDRPQILERIAPRSYPAPLLAESIVYQTLRDYFGWYWPTSLITEERFEKSPGVVWHCSDPIEVYKDLARRFDVELDDDFSIAGWDVAGGREYQR